MTNAVRITYTAIIVIPAVFVTICGLYHLLDLWNREEPLECDIDNVVAFNIFTFGATIFHGLLIYNVCIILRHFWP